MLSNRSFLPIGASLDPTRVRFVYGRDCRQRILSFVDREKTPQGLSRFVSSQAVEVASVATDRVTGPI